MPHSELKPQDHGPGATLPSVSQRAVHDTAKQFAGQLAVGAFALVFSAWLNRMLPAKELALWPVCMSLGAVVAAFSSFGLGDTFVRLIPALLVKGQQEEASATLKTGLLVNLVGCAAFSIATYLLADQAARYLLHDVNSASLVRVMAFAAFFNALGERLSWALQSVQEFGKRAIINVVTGVIRTPLAVLLYITLGGARGIIVALTIAPAIACLLSVIWLWRHVFCSRRLRSPKGLLSFSLPFYGASLISLLSARANNLVIALMVKPEVLAAYFVAASVAGYVDALDKFAIGATIPKLAETGAHAPDATERVFSTCTRYAFLGLLPVHVLAAVAATPLMQLYGGHKYAGAGWVLTIMCIGLFISLLYQIHRAYIQVFARPAHLFSLTVCQGVENIASLVLLVPRLGAMGAALSDAVVSSLQAIVSALFLRRTMRLSYDPQALRSALVASALSAAVLWFGRSLWANHASLVLPGLMVAAVVYVLALSRQLKRGDAELILTMIPPRLREARAGQAFARGLVWLWART